jgi:hypothetical protein
MGGLIFYKYHAALPLKMLHYNIPGWKADDICRKKKGREF